MALTKNSVLHYYDARYSLAIPRVGGRPHFTRNSAGTWIDQEGFLNSAIINTPRAAWETIAGERRPTQLLQPAATNPILYSSDLSNAVWAKTNITVTTGRPDPMGGTSASTITATANNGEIEQLLSNGSSIFRTASFWLRRRTGTGDVRIWSAASDDVIVVPVTSQWQRFSKTNVAAAVTRTNLIRLATSGDAVDVFGCQIDDSRYTTSTIPTTSAAVTRAADECYWDFFHTPQAMMIYVRFTERGSISVFDGLGTVLSIGNDSAPYVALNENGGTYQIWHHNGTLLRAGAVTGVPVIGDTVELLGIVFADGSVKLVQSINGAAGTTGAASTACTLQPAWATTRLYANSLGTIRKAASNIAEIKIVKYADVTASTDQGRLEELRNFELGPNGEVLIAA